MRVNLLSHRIQLQQRAVTEGALGQTVTWRPVLWRHGRVIPLSVSTAAKYHQLNTLATHRIIFDDDTTLNLADYRFKHKDKTYEPSQPPLVLDDNKTIIVNEV